MSEETCRNCAGRQRVCENHMDRPWSEKVEGGCVCGAGAPCPVCRFDLATAGLQMEIERLTARQAELEEPRGRTLSADSRKALLALASDTGEFSGHKWTCAERGEVDGRCAGHLCRLGLATMTRWRVRGFYKATDLGREVAAALLAAT